MNKIEHLEYLEVLESMRGKSLIFPKKEGAFWWDDLMAHNEYCDKYKEECVKRGWINNADV